MHTKQMCGKGLHEKGTVWCVSKKNHTESIIWKVLHGNCEINLYDVPHLDLRAEYKTLVSITILITWYSIRYHAFCKDLKV